MREEGRLASKFAGNQGGLPLWKVLRCGNVVPGDKVFVRTCHGQLFVHLILGHVVVARVKVLLLEMETRKTLIAFRKAW